MSYYNLATLGELERHLFICKDNRCVFISHKKEDEAAAIAIGSYLTDVVGINIYLDIKDCMLQDATDEENNQKIVDSVQKGLSLSSHLLCLISDKTKLSWWVPYEIGFADKQNTDVTILKLKDIDDVPSYIKIKKTLYNLDDFLQYVSNLGKYGFLFKDEHYNHFSRCDNSILTNYIDKTVEA